MTDIPYSLSRISSGLKRSVMRDLLKFAVSPDIISFAGGLPANECMPLEEFRECVDAVLSRDGARVLQYSPPFDPLREWIAATMRSRGVECTAENVFITNGCQQGLTIMARLLLDPGDAAVVEEITFTGVRQVIDGQGGRMLTVSTDLETGVDVDALEALLSSPLARKPRAAILITDFHNPLGVSISVEKRERIAELAAMHRVPVIEDDPYSALRYSGEAIPPIKAFDSAGAVIYVGSFSKMLAPAARLGWIVAPAALIPRITVVRESIDLESSGLMQRAVFEFLSRGHLEPHLARLNAVNRERQAAMLDALERRFGGIARWSVPQGGLFVWVTLPEGVDTGTMFEAAIARRVAYIPGAAFAVNGGHTNTMRLNYSSAAPGAIGEGIERLAALVRQRLAEPVISEQ
ncbi:MAG TPA: PLP-dependent aminotransferase family protein [Anaerolineae bacterium]|nr:PLP-dependent aminotransferase family protein [Anaerolineae bacterium]